MKFRLIAAVVLIAVPTSGGLNAQDLADNSAASWAAIASCGAIADNDARHACVDEVLARAGVLTPRVAEQTRENFGIDRRTTERNAAAIIVPSPAPAPVAASTPVINDITTTIASVSEVGYQRIRVTTAEGSVWEQSQAGTFTSFPKAGDAFIIERGAVSGFRCKFARASVYRCVRVQ